MMHIYGQPYPGHDAFIMADRNSLLKLKGMIEKLLEGEEQNDRNFCCGDGNTYTLHVVRLEDEQVLTTFQLPYTHFHSEGTTPFDVINKYTNEVLEITSGLKALAKRLEIPIEVSRGTTISGRGRK